MARRGRGAAVAIVLVAMVSPGGATAETGVQGGPHEPAAVVASPNPVWRWDRLVLDAIREMRPGPTVAARALAVVHTCMYDAWAAYDQVAVGSRLGASLRRPPEQRTPEAKEEAVSRAARLAAADLFPTHRPLRRRTGRRGSRSRQPV